MVHSNQIIQVQGCQNTVFHRFRCPKSFWFKKLQGRPSMGITSSGTQRLSGSKTVWESRTFHDYLAPKVFHFQKQYGGQALDDKTQKHFLFKEIIDNNSYLSKIFYWAANVLYKMEEIKTTENITVHFYFGLIPIVPHYIPTVPLAFQVYLYS